MTHDEEVKFKELENRVRRLEEVALITQSESFNRIQHHARFDTIGEILELSVEECRVRFSKIGKLKSMYGRE